MPHAARHAVRACHTGWKRESRPHTLSLGLLQVRPRGTPDTCVVRALEEALFGARGGPPLVR